MNKKFRRRRIHSTEKGVPEQLSTHFTDSLMTGTGAQASLLNPASFMYPDYTVLHIFMPVTYF